MDCWKLEIAATTAPVTNAFDAMAAADPVAAAPQGLLATV